MSYYISDTMSISSDPCAPRNRILYYEICKQAKPSVLMLMSALRIWFLILFLKSQSGVSLLLSTLL